VSVGTERGQQHKLLVWWTHHVNMVLEMGDASAFCHRLNNDRSLNSCASADFAIGSPGRVYIEAELTACAVVGDDMINDDFVPLI
jgi:hypothetical protein